MGKPAARVTDLHVCPMVTGVVPHVGGPILPPAMPTVLTGSLPQARMGDMCVCVGPVDTIIMGSPTVLVGGKMAARIGDPTSHGGVITLGMFTVLIGEAAGGGGGGGGGASAGGGPAGGAGGALAAMAAGLGAAGVAPPVVAPPSSACMELAVASDRAMLAEHTYGRSGALPPGYRQVDEPAELAMLGLRPQDLAPAGSTFKAEVFVQDSAAGPAYTVAFRGTAESADWIANAQQGVGMKSDHYDRAINIGRLVSEASDGPVAFTGHSLGGGLASAAAAATGRPATTFNAAGLSARTVGKYPAVAAPVTSYNVPGELLSAVQDNRALVLTGLQALAGAVHPSLGGLVGGWILGRELGDSPILPQAYGERRTLPLAPPAGKTTLQQMNPVDRHGMDWVTEGIKADQRDQGC
ncbi:PAAR domain-containing protein [Polymorphobacter fuscus]|uniref:DUF2974 domain-containing protein n=1 Tax=Sandarakinorhabdus fusca TaxID=1439888 RepID=A0A7C9GSH6_9SPHN|nr:PAAR domain-containing protein [Polymorphobacter fuscus]KAB7648270.1 DUF2974 domain-containing protein [Polymorphobacter fuscus]MQT15778.1 DUF2974 domain-containing protein [Polymorphobacter fuscus]NJC07949.1 putative Zn-binding protein involved in type VI secretion [Polymorphobacter fuscus]